MVRASSERGYAMPDRQGAFRPIDSAAVPRFAEPATFMRTPHVASAAGLDIAPAGAVADFPVERRSLLSQPPP